MRYGQLKRATLFHASPSKNEVELNDAECSVKSSVVNHECHAMRIIGWVSARIGLASCIDKSAHSKPGELPCRLDSEMSNEADKSRMLQESTSCALGVQGVVRRACCSARRIDAAS